MKKYKNQFGRSMVEMLGVLAIIGVLSVGGIAGYSAAMEKHKINQTLVAMQAAVTNVQTLFVNEVNFSALGTAASTGIDDNDNATNTTDLAYQILSGLNLSSSYDIIISKTYKNGFYVSARLLSEKACVSIATQQWNQYKGEFAGVSAGDSSASDELTIKDIVSDCKSRPDVGLYVSIYFDSKGNFEEISASTSSGNY